MSAKYDTISHGNLAVFTGRPAEHFDEAGRLAGAEDADAKNFAGHPESGDGHDKQ